MEGESSTASMHLAIACPFLFDREGKLLEQLDIPLCQGVLANRIAFLKVLMKLLAQLLAPGRVGMGTASGSPTWQDHPNTTTPITAAAHLGPA